MESIKKLYKIGNGPSSSHTMGPKRAAEQFLVRYPNAEKYVVTLYGSLAATGKGHLTDVAIMSVLDSQAPTTIIWKPEVFLKFHPNGMNFKAYFDSEEIGDWTIFSIGGGDLANEETVIEHNDIYPMSNISDIEKWCDEEGRNYWEYVDMCEGDGIWDYLADIWRTMCDTIEKGLQNEGVLPGGLKVSRKASTYYIKAQGQAGTMNSRGKLYAYALATAEENAAGGTVVTAPTCGSSGVLPAVLYHLQMSRSFQPIRIYRALATAAVFGNVVKANASISGAEVGCQGEIGDRKSVV